MMKVNISNQNKNSSPNIYDKLSKLHIVKFPFVFTKIFSWGYF